MEEHVLTVGLYRSKHAEILMSNHRDKSRKETDGAHPQRHKMSMKWTPSISSFTDSALQLSEVNLHVLTAQV